jgi:hypothetical protein
MFSLLPHELTDDVRENRLTVGRQLLEILERAQSTDFHRLVSGAESWIYLSCASRAVWTMLRDEVPTREKQEISTRKFVLTVFSELVAFAWLSSFRLAQSSTQPSLQNISFDHSPRRCKCMPPKDAGFLIAFITTMLALTILCGLEHQPMIMRFTASPIRDTVGISHRATSTYSTP